MSDRTELAALNQYMRSGPFNEWLDITVESLADGRAVLSMPHETMLTNPGDGEMIHGGVCASLVDVAGGMAIMHTLDDDDVFLATTDMNVRYLRPATADLRAVGTVERVGSTLAIATVEISDADSAEDNAVVLGSVSFKLVRSK